MGDIGSYEFFLFRKLQLHPLRFWEYRIALLILFKDFQGLLNAHGRFSNFKFISFCVDCERGQGRL
jgi:hypothetical protein